MSRDARPGVGNATRFALLVTVCAIALVFAAPPSRARAHVPFIESARPSDAASDSALAYPGAQTLPTPDISRAIYGYLAPNSTFDAYSFAVPQGVTTEVSLIVPKRAGLESFRPSLQIVSATDGSSIAIPDPGDQPRTSFYEPFSISSFWSGPSRSVTFEPGTQYYILVKPPATGTASGAYVLTFGGAEKFSAADWASTREAMPVIWLGSWAGGPVRPGLAVCGAVLVLALLAAGWLLIRRRRGRSPRPSA